MRARGGSTSTIISTGSDPSRLRKHAVVIANHGTSVSLEDGFWEVLKFIASMRGVSLNQLISEIDRDRNGNLSSAIRIFVLKILLANEVDCELSKIEKFIKFSDR